MWRLCFLAVFNILILLGCFGRGLDTSSLKKVGDFSLLDHDGRYFQLSRQQPKKFVVLISYVNGCPIVRQQTPEIKEVLSEFGNDVAIFFLNSSLSDDRNSLVKEHSEFQLPAPILHDPSQAVGKLLGYERTGEAIIINQSDRAVLWRGPVTGRLGYGTQKASSEKNSFLLQALRSLENGKMPEKATAPVLGCAITYEQFQATYTKDVAPVLVKSCLFCHTEAGPGPWSMDDYGKVKSWGAMIKDVLLTRRMPPWHVDSHYGEYHNDYSLTPQQKARIIAWVDNGAPRGEGDDPLPEKIKKAYAKADYSTWSEGEPDIVVDLPPFEVPATGILPYEYYMVPVPLEKDIWMDMLQMRVKDIKSIHHIMVYKAPPELCHDQGQPRSVMFDIVGGYSAGAVHFPRPKDHALRLEKGQCLSVEVHYNPYGRPHRNQVSFGIYKIKNKPKYTYEFITLDDRGMKIPARHRAHPVKVTHIFRKDRTILALFPHMHLRGQSMRYKLVKTDGDSRVIFSVPHFNFNFQPIYGLKPPMKVKKGDRLVVEGIYDNSQFNPYNPDPNQIVHWGVNIADEMFYSVLSFSEKVP